MAEEGIDAVKLLTVHKAKGLEFPVVVLAGLQARSRAGRAGVRLSRDWSRGVWALRIGDVRTLGMVWAEDRDDSTSDAEERRLFYVAATRARERLVFSAAVRHGRGGKPAEAKDLLAYLNEALGADVRDGGADSYTVGDGRVERVCVTPPPDAAVADEGGEEVSLPEGLEAAWRARRERAEGARRLRLDVRPSDLGDEEGGFGKPDSETEGVPREAAIRVGIVVHGVMEGIDLKGPAKDLDGLVRTVLEGAFPEIPEAEARRIHREAKEIVEGFLASADFGTKIRPCEVLGREVPCFLPGDGEGGMGGAVEGYADLVLRDDRGIWVIDYKTDRIDPSEAERRAEAHLPQGRFYARALSRALGTEVRRFGVAFLRPAVVVELEVGEG
ncbi:MAG: 3'-5' exonuclease [Nitrospinota bacterium]